MESRRFFFSWLPPRGWNLCGVRRRWLCFSHRCGHSSLRVYFYFVYRSLASLGSFKIVASRVAISSSFSDIVLFFLPFHYFFCSYLYIGLISAWSPFHLNPSSPNGGVQPTLQNGAQVLMNEGQKSKQPGTAVNSCSTKIELLHWIVILYCGYGYALIYWNYLNVWYYDRYIFGVFSFFLYF